jgi:hypothetical protein
MMQGPSPKPINNKNIQDSDTAEKIEIFIQQKYNITIPALFFRIFINRKYRF